MTPQLISHYCAIDKIVDVSWRRLCFLNAAVIFMLKERKNNNLYSLPVDSFPINFSYKFQNRFFRSRNNENDAMSK